MNELIKHAIDSAIPIVVPIVITGITAAFGWLGQRAFMFLGKKIKESNTKIDDYLAGVAVKYTEDHFGPDTDNGAAKRQAAVDYLIKNSQNHLTQEQAEALVRSAYQSIFGNLGELKNASAPLPTQRQK